MVLGLGSYSATIHFESALPTSIRDDSFSIQGRSKSLNAVCVAQIDQAVLAEHLARVAIGSGLSRRSSDHSSLSNPVAACATVLHASHSMTKRRSSPISCRIMTVETTMLRLHGTTFRQSSRAKRKPRAKRDSRPQFKKKTDTRAQAALEHAMTSANSGDLTNNSPHPPDQTAELPQLSEDSWSSPDAHVALIRGTGNGFADYVSRLRYRNRCSVVAYSDRGAQCVAVAAAEDDSALVTMHVSIVRGSLLCSSLALLLCK